MFFEQPLDQAAIRDIAQHEMVSSIVLDRRQGVEIARVRQLVEIDDMIGFFAQPLSNEATADEAGATSDQNGCHRGNVLRAMLALFLERKTCFAAGIKQLASTAGNECGRVL